MATAQDFLEYLELQREPKLVTKSELIDAIRGRGKRISDRLLTYYSSEGLVPKSVRIGSRSGAYPAKVVDLLDWIIEFRNRGVSVDALKEMLPIWKWLQRAHREHLLNLAEFELVCRNSELSHEALFSLPPLVFEVFDCPGCLAKTKLVLKDGSEVDAKESPTLSFALLDPSVEAKDADQSSRSIFTTTLTLPVGPVGVDDPHAIVLDLPPLETGEEEQAKTPSKRPRAKGGEVKPKARTKE